MASQRLAAANVTTSDGPQKPYVLPLRDLFDVAALNDLPKFLTVVRGTNPYDISPGLKLILKKMAIRPETPNPYVEWNDSLGFGADPQGISELRDSEGNSGLHIAAQLGHVKFLQALVQEAFCDVHAVNTGGFSPLHLAALNGRVECVKMLIRYGADPLALTRLDAPVYPGRTAIFLAHWRQHYATVKCLEPYFGVIQKYSPLVEEILEPGGPTSLGGEVKKVSPPVPEPPFAALSNAARVGNAFFFAKLFDFVDCMESVVGTLPLKGADELLVHLSSSVSHILPLLLTNETVMSPEKLFIFRGLFYRGLIPSPSLNEVVSVESNFLVEQVLKSGEVEAFRVLYEEGLNISGRVSSLTVFLPKDEERGGNLQLLLQELELKDAYEEAMAAYRKKHHSVVLHTRARIAKKRLICLRMEVEKRGLKPFSRHSPDSFSKVYY